MPHIKISDVINSSEEIILSNIINYDYEIMYDEFDENRNNILMIAILHKKFNLAAYFIKNYTGLIADINNKGETPLILCCKKKYSNLALMLLDYGSDDIWLSHTDNRGLHALFHACNNKMESVILEILEFGSIHCKLNLIEPKNEYTPFMIACKHKLTFVVLRMLEFGEDDCLLSHIPKDNFTTPLILLAQNEMVSIIHYILNNFPKSCNINHITKTGKSLQYYIEKYELLDLEEKIKSM